MAVVQMAADNWGALLLGAVIGATAMFCALYSVGWRRVHRGSQTLLYPTVDRRPMRDRWRAARTHYAGLRLSHKSFHALIGFMTVVVVVSGVQLFTFTSEQRRCNDELKRVIGERATITSDDNRLRTDNDNAGLDALTGLLTIDPTLPPAEQSTKSRQLLQAYADRIKSNNAKQAENEAKRAENPYPDPQC